MAKSKEERLAAARAKVKKLKDASKQRSRADRMDWRPKALVYLHPDTDIHERRRVWFAKEVDEKDDAKKKDGKGKGKKKRIVNLPFNVSEDPECDAFYLLRKVLKEDEEIDGDEVILVVGSGRDKVEYRKGDILNWDDFDYKKRLYPQSDFVCAAVMVENKKGDEVDKPKIETLSGAKTLGKEIVKEIETEVDESGDEEGNPFLNPYPFLIEYDESASGTDMYTASARTKKSPSKAVAEILEQDAPDLSDEIKVDDSEVVHAMLIAALVYDLEIPEPKDAVFKDPKKGEDQVEDPPDAGAADPPEDDEVAEAEAALAAAREVKKKAEDAAKKKAKAEAKKKAEAEAKKQADEEEDPVAAAEAALAAAKAAKKAADKPKTTTRRKAVAKDPEPDADDFPNPPGPRPDDENVGWWPTREEAESEKYDVCPKCERPVREEDKKCPHRDCGVEYAPAGDAF